MFKKILFTGIILFLSFAFTGAAQAYTFHLQPVDSAAPHNPVKNAYIMVVDFGGYSVCEGYTDGDGYFSCGGLADGGYTYHFVKNCWQTREGNFAIWQGDVTWPFPVNRTCSFSSVYVLDGRDDHSPIIGATIQLWRNGVQVPPDLFTGGEGRVEFVSNYETLVKVHKTGFIDQQWTLPAGTYEWVFYLDRESGTPNTHIQALNASNPTTIIHNPHFQINDANHVDEYGQHPLIDAGQPCDAHHSNAPNCNTFHFQMVAGELGMITVTHEDYQTYLGDGQDPIVRVHPNDAFPIFMYPNGMARPQYYANVYFTVYDAKYINYIQGATVTLYFGNSVVYQNSTNSQGQVSFSINDTYRYEVTKDDYISEEGYVLPGEHRTIWMWPVVHDPNASITVRRLGDGALLDRARFEVHKKQLPYTIIYYFECGAGCYSYSFYINQDVWAKVYRDGYWYGQTDISPGQNVTVYLEVPHNGGFVDMPCGGCFLAGTPIQMANGTFKPIEKVLPGEMVLAFDEKTGKVMKDKVKTFFVHEADSYLEVNGKVKVTGEHPFYVNGKWVEARFLKKGDKLTTLEGKLEAITSIKTIKQKVLIYNLEVNPYHTYFAAGYLVHNKPWRYCAVAEP